MQEGYLFFGLMWLGCWYVTFISNESVEVRRRGVIRQLGGICFAGLSIYVFNTTINLFLIAGSIWSVYQWRNWTNKELYKGTSALICLVISLLCIRIYSLLYPVWFIVDWIYITAPLLVVLSIVFLEPAKQVCILNLAIILGETIYALMLDTYGFPIKNIGTFESLDLLLLTLTIAAVFNKAQILWIGRGVWRKTYHQQTIGGKGKGVR